MTNVNVTIYRNGILNDYHGWQVDMIEITSTDFQCNSDCPADVNSDGVVDVLDLLDVLAAWGNAGGPEDINGDGVIDVLDPLVPAMSNRQSPPVEID